MCTQGRLELELSLITSMSLFFLLYVDSLLSLCPCFLFTSTVLIQTHGEAENEHKNVFGAKKKRDSHCFNLLKKKASQPDSSPPLPPPSPVSPPISTPTNPTNLPPMPPRLQPHPPPHPLTTSVSKCSTTTLTPPPSHLLALLAIRSAIATLLCMPTLQFTTTATHSPER